MDLEAALEYARRHGLHALTVLQDGQPLFEEFGEGHGPVTPHALYSGTKSFWGVLAVSAVEDGLLLLDEPVAATVAAWKSDPWKARVTLRQLLDLTCGIGFGGLGNAVPLRAASLDTVLKTEPGTSFTYSGIPLQVFGAVLERKLESRRQTPHQYLAERLLDPIGLQIANWRTLKDGTQPLPTGAFVAAREWMKYGEFLRTSRDRFASCFEGSAVNPRYGLGFWLQPLAQAPGIFYASGSGGQALYVIPAERAVVVHFGGSSSYKHETFLGRLMNTGARRRGA